MQCPIRGRVNSHKNKVTGVASRVVAPPVPPIHTTPRLLVQLLHETKIPRDKNTKIPRDKNTKIPRDKRLKDKKDSKTIL